MQNPYNFPKLRWPLDLRFEEVQGNRVLVIQCPVGIAPEPLVLVSAVAPIIGSFEGDLSVDQITAKFASYGISKDLVQQLVTMLDDNLFLNSPKFLSAERNVKDEYNLSPVRAASRAGLIYPKDPTHLGKVLDGHLSNRFSGSLPTWYKPEKTTLSALVSPHIDYLRGGPCYGITWNMLRDQQHDLYVVIGTSHQYSRNMFHLTRKDFDSPFGIFPTDKTFVEALANRYGHARSFADEILHRREHSLELQLPFLGRTKGIAKIVPILVGSFHHLLTADRDPQAHDEYESFVAALAEELKEEIARGKRVAIIAGVDMAHVGQAFGDEKKLTPEFMQHVEQRDMQYLDCIARQDKSALFSHIAEDEDARKMCGFPSMYTTLDLFDRIGLKYKSALFDYRQAVDYATDCAVTFAGMGLYQVST